MADYNNNGEIIYCKTNWDEVMQFLYSIAAPNSVVIVFSNTSCFTNSTIAAKNAGFKNHNFQIWNKSRKMPTMYGMKQFEPIHFLYTGKAKMVNFPSRSDILTYNLNRQTSHKTEKPIDLLIDLITNNSNEGDVIFDPFAGSGTTAAAALRTNRKIISAEIITEHFIQTIRRIMQQPPNLSGKW